MRTIIFFVLLSLSISALAEEGRLKIFIIPAAHRLNWSTNTSIVTSFIKSETRAFNNNGFRDAQRKAIGHVVAQIECISTTRWTGLSINSWNLAPSIIVNGVAGMFDENPHGYMQSEDEIKRFIVNNSIGAFVLNYPVKQSNCESMLRMDDFFRAQDKVWFAPLMDSLDNYQSGLDIGGSGASYVAALKGLDTSNRIDLKIWIEKVRIPGSRSRYTFFSVQSMWDYASSLHSSSLHSRYVEVVNHKGRKVKIPGLH